MDDEAAFERLDTRFADEIAVCRTRAAWLYCIEQYRTRGTLFELSTPPNDDGLAWVTHWLDDAGSTLGMLVYVPIGARGRWTR